MADISLNDFPVYLDRMLRKYVDAGVNIMKEEAPYRTGDLVRSIHDEKVGEYAYFIGTDIDYAGIVVKGRGEVKPKFKKALWDAKHGFFDHPVAKVGPAEPNDFVKRAKERIENLSF